MSTVSIRKTTGDDYAAIKAAVDQVIADMLKAVPLERLILDSDMGQRGNGSPVEGMYRFIRLLMDKFGLSEAYIDLIAKKNPAALLGV